MWQLWVVDYLVDLNKFMRGIFYPPSHALGKAFNLWHGFVSLFVFGNSSVIPKSVNESLFNYHGRFVGKSLRIRWCFLCRFYFIIYTESWVNLWNEMQMIWH